ncbi:MAG TPA: anhydro-N-acetylmuramic acid kinase [Cellvibrionales bacterium]|nr:anhydro-N-acetylmuramic acid kinase [Cellvibrionales bacterium]
MNPLFIGLMSGTSVDSIDAALLEFSNTNKPKLIATHSHAIPKATQQLVHALCQPGNNEIEIMGRLDRSLGTLFAEATIALVSKTQYSNKDITAIGSHGQTIRHRPSSSPDTEPSFSLQIADPNTIAQLTGITTVADFRRRDIAAGGQGAPLTPAFHRAICQEQTAACVILNLGGIANLTVVSNNEIISGFDTGPANTLLDGWTQRHKEQPFDNDGQWASTGQCQPALLNQLKAHPYFTLAAPKSTGREQFNLQWLDAVLADADAQHISTEDVQATLTQLSCDTIATQLLALPDEVKTVYCCGGGTHNRFLLAQLAAACPDHRIVTTEALGIDPDWLEAAAFAWLAKQALANQAVDLGNATNADQAAILGGVYLA